MTVAASAPRCVGGVEAYSVGVRLYELEVGGELSDDAAPAFEGMRLERRDGTTILVGDIRDQAALQGVLSRISDLGLTLLSAKSLDE